MENQTKYDVIIIGGSYVRIAASMNSGNRSPDDPGYKLYQGKGTGILIDDI